MVGRGLRGAKKEVRMWLRGWNEVGKSRRMVGGGWKEQKEVGMRLKGGWNVVGRSRRILE